jgi:oligopeptide transport system permease protein
MGRYVVRRLLQMILVLFGASLILFVSLFVLPGDPIGTTAGERARDPAVRAVLAKRYGLDKPIPVQYVRYVRRVIRGDLGESYRLRRPVSAILRSRFGATAELALAAIAFEILIGISAGVVAAVFRYSFWDVLVTLTTTLAIGIPTYVGGSILQGIFAQKYHWFPRSGRAGLSSIILPAFTLASVDAALVARLMRGTMLEVLRADYVRTAFAKGLSKRTVILKHVLRNSVIPVVTYLGIAFGGLLGGALITEAIFNWPGIGLALATAISAQDNPIIVAVVTYGVGAFVIVNLIVDLAYAYLDPRIRLE